MTIKRTLGPVIPSQVMNEMLAQRYHPLPELGLDHIAYGALASAVLGHDALQNTYDMYSELIKTLLETHHGAAGDKLYTDLEAAHNSLRMTFITAAGAAGFYLGACHARNNPDYEPDHTTLFNLQEYLTEWASKDCPEPVRQFLETLKGGAAHAG